MPTTKQILADAGFKNWWDRRYPGLQWETQVERGKRNWLADYEEYLIAQGIYPPWKTETPTEPEETIEWTDAQLDEYNQYLEFLKQNPDLGLPTPEDIADYFAHRDEWIEDTTPEEEKEEEEEEREFTDEEKREYYTYREYASTYGEPNDWYPLDIKDYFKNWDVAQEQLGEWKTEETEQNKEYTPEQQREYNTYRSYASRYSDPSDWYPLDIGDYFANQSVAQQQLQKWVAEEGEYEAEEAEYEKWQLTPEEEAKRREESYAYSQWAREQAEYGAKEAYQETPEYAQSFTEWFSTQGTKSQPLQAFIEGMYGKLKTQYEATQPREVGYATREEGRAEAARREAGFEAWLPAQTSEIGEQFWAQSPWEREERPGVYAPRMRTVSW